MQNLMPCSAQVHSNTRSTMPTLLQHQLPAGLLALRCLLPSQVPAAALHCRPAAHSWLGPLLSWRLGTRWLAPPGMVALLHVAEMRLPAALAQRQCLLALPTAATAPRCASAPPRRTPSPSALPGWQQRPRPLLQQGRIGDGGTAWLNLHTHTHTHVFVAPLPCPAKRALCPPASVSSATWKPACRPSSTLARTQCSVATPHTNRARTRRPRSHSARPGAGAGEGARQQLLRAGIRAETAPRGCRDHAQVAMGMQRRAARAPRAAEVAGILSGHGSQPMRSRLLLRAANCTPCARTC